MKKFSLCLLSFFMMAMCVCSFTACSSDDDDPVASSPIVGTWVERFDYDAYVQVTTFVFGADGKGFQRVRLEYPKSPAINLDPIAFNYTYNAGKETIQLKFEGDGTLYSGVAAITGNTLMLRYNDTYYSLTKQ